MKKKIIAIILLLATVFAFAACGEAPEEPIADGQIVRKTGPALEVYAAYKAEAEAASRAMVARYPKNADKCTVEPYPLKAEYEPEWDEEQNEKNVPENMLYINSPTAIERGVYIGYNDWYYYYDTIADYTGRNLMSDGELLRWLNTYQKQYDYCKQNGIEYYLTFAPNKNTIYPEYMHESYTRAEYTRMDQLVEYIKANSDIPVIEVKDDLLEAKAADPDTFLYHRLDTHWNQHAGFIAVNAILEELQTKFPTLELLKEDEYRVDYMETYMKDQAWYIGYYDSFYQEAPQYTPINGWQAELLEIDDTMFGQCNFAYVWPDGYQECNHVSVFTNPQKADAPSVVMFRDSFAIPMIHFMTEAFSDISFYWSDFDIIKLRLAEPDVVIVEIAERNLEK